jgi:diguanylate cyclase (GGDEF)-like protein
VELTKEAQSAIVLVVDDERINLEILRSVLKDMCTVRGAINGEQALKAARLDPPPDLILLDIQMKGMDGYEVCRRLKSDPLTRHIPVIFVTGKDQEDDETMGFDVGAVDYINKPIRPAIVRARVKLHLELKKERDYHARASSIDGLTGIPNRRHFSEYSENELHRARRNQKSLAVAMLDIDFFKLFNDNYGHLAGDECLKQVAATIDHTLRRSADMAARYGGEEFVCLFPDTDEEGACVICDEILQAIRDLKIEHTFSKNADIVTVSIGCVARIPEQNESLEDLIKQADERLYRAKNSGRNRVVCRDE